MYVCILVVAVAVPEEVGLGGVARVLHAAMLLRHRGLVRSMEV
jgi:hypothetical protein